MSSPEQRFEYATTTLRAEAGVWDEAGDKMRAIARLTEEMDLTRVEAGMFQLIVAPYNSVVMQVHQRCLEGATAMTGIGDTLVEIANNMDITDATNQSLIGSAGSDQPEDDK